MTNKKRLLPLGFIAMLVAIPVAAVVGNPVEARWVLRQGWDHPTILAVEMENFLRENLPFREEFRSAALTLRIAGGASERDGVFLAEDGLIPNLTVTADTTLHRGNTRQILAAIEDTSSPACFMLIPTSCAIYSDRLPDHLPLYNQRNYIENTYKQFYGSATTVDAYNALLYADSDYLYYRTEDNLTSLGGYALYQALASRLGFTAKPLSQFEASYDVHDFYGDLYRRWDGGGVRPDIITTYRDVSGSSYSRVMNWQRFVQKTYYTLYPQEAAITGEEMNILLGGYAPRIEIETEGTRSSTLLLIGDRTALSYLPFLAGHYQRITFLDFSLLTASEIGAFDPGEYTQVLFAYSLDSYLNTEHPAKAANLRRTQPEEEEKPRQATVVIGGANRP